VTARLSAATLDRAAGPVRRPGYDFSRLRPGIVHLGLGAFHRAHQAAFTEERNSAERGDWGVNWRLLRTPTSPKLFVRRTASTRSRCYRRHRSTALSASFAAPSPQWAQPADVLAALAAPEFHVISLTVTEKGYTLAPPRRAR